MGITKPFVSKNPEVNELANWVIRNFASREDSRKAFIDEIPAGNRSFRDAKQEDGEIRYRRHEDTDGKFIQPIVRHEGIAYPLLAAQGNRS